MAVKDTRQITITCFGLLSTIFAVSYAIYKCACAQESGMLVNASYFWDAWQLQAQDRNILLAAGCDRVPESL